MKTYEPKPISTSQVELSSDLSALIEKLAENNHDHWARQRIAEGWRFGPARNDASKQHPDLVAYAELPDSEKEYDRQTVIQTLKTIVAMGYEIRRR